MQERPQDGDAEALVARLADRDAGVARAAAEALVGLARLEPGVLTRLREALREGPARGRVQAALALAELEPPQPALLPALVEGLDAEDGAVRWAAARLLVETGRLHGEVLPLLLGLVRGREPVGVRRMAAFCLRELAPERPEAARVLLGASRDPEPIVRRAASTALAALVDPPPEVTARLLEALEADADGAVRCIAAAALGELARGDARAEAVRARLRAARDGANDPALREAAERALARLGEDARP